jgi:hypothetical protein
MVRVRAISCLDNKEIAYVSRAKLPETHGVFCHWEGDISNNGSGH